MRKLKLLTIAAIILSMVLATGCIGGKNDPKKTEQPKEEDETEINFSYSYGIDENGFWKNIKALDYVELCDYKNISVSNDIHEISEDIIDDEIGYILSEFADYREVKDRAVKDKDTLNIDYVGKIDGEEFDGGSTKGEGTDVTIGVTQYIDDFLEQLIGHKPGETFDIEVTFPEDYGNEELDGKDAVFTVTINYILEEILPELTDDFVKENLSETYGWNTVAEMKESIRKDYQQMNISDYVNEYIFENTEIKSVPESMIKYQENMMLHYFDSNAKMYGMKLDEFISLFVGVSSQEELIEMYAEENENSAKMNLIIQAIAEDLELTVTEDEMKIFFDMDEEELADLEKEYGKPYLKLIVLNDKVNTYIIDNVIKL